MIGMQRACKFVPKQESLTTSSRDARMGAAFRTMRDCDWGLSDDSDIY